MQIENKITVPEKRTPATSLTPLFKDTLGLLKQNPITVIDNRTGKQTVMSSTDYKKRKIM